MSTLKVIGGKQLRGEVIPQGAKNEALQVICATLLAEDGIVSLANMPNIKDTENLLKIIKGLGVKVSSIDETKKQFGFNATSLVLDSSIRNFQETEEFLKLFESIRASLMLAGPLLARFKYVCFPSPGGDKIGARPIDVHLLGLEKLGVVFKKKDSKIIGTTPNGLVGADILLEEASVTGTANILMASVLAKGETVIRNAACEPYVEQLCIMLNKMGANISGVGSNVITIQGVEKLHGCEHTILPDMIEIGSFIGLAASTKSDITIKDVRWEKLGLMTRTFEKLGIVMEKRNDDIFVNGSKSLPISRMHDGRILVIKDGIWPAFSPDLISIAIVTSVFREGCALFHQWMFENRLYFVDQLIQMGASIVLNDPHRVTVIGDSTKNLRGIEMNSPDIRAGMALLIAALSAEGESTIKNAEQIDRGYENIDERLRSLGADIERID